MSNTNSSSTNYESSGSRLMRLALGVPLVGNAFQGLVVLGIGCTFDPLP